jgi:predicted DNA-binding transcriptional regulator AlpA
VTDHLLGSAEVAEMLGVSRQRVHQLVTRSDFPEPVAVLSGGRIWRRGDVEAWARRTGRIK